MTQITSVRDIQGFNEEQYQTLLESAKSQNINPDTVDFLLLKTANEERGNFSNTFLSVADELPTLIKPHENALYQLTSLAGAPSPGATILAMIVDLTADERKQNATIRIDQTKMIVEKIHSQADEMRSKATAQLAMGVVSGLVSITQGAVALGVQSKGTAKMNNIQQQSQTPATNPTAQPNSSVAQNNTASPLNNAVQNTPTTGTQSTAPLNNAAAATGAQTAPNPTAQQSVLLPATEATADAPNTTNIPIIEPARHAYDVANLQTQANIAAVNSMVGGTASMIGGIGQSIGSYFDANIKDMDGDIEKMRAFRDAMKSLDDSLAQTISKALSSMDAVQQNMNQTRTRILG